MTTPDPLAAIDAVRRACRSAEGHDPIDEAVHLRLKNHGLAGTASWVEADGFALRHERSLDLAVSPGARGRGVGARLAALACAGPGELTAWSHGDHPGARALAARLGFTPARELWVMRRAADVPLPPSAPPPGVTIRPFGAAGDAGALLAVNEAAFEGHPEQGTMSADDLAERMAEPWFDPSGLLLAFGSQGELLGFHWTKRHDADHGEVYVVGVSPDAHGRGLGRLLTVAGLRHLARYGVAEVHLYVESDNAAALRLYAGLDFAHAPADTHVQYQRQSQYSPRPHESPSSGYHWTL